jgi:hypothetical protein
VSCGSRVLQKSRGGANEDLKKVLFKNLGEVATLVDGIYDLKMAYKNKVLAGAL